MAKAFLSDLFGELFTKKTCIYLPHYHETFNENCIVWETKYFFRKEVYSSRGKLKLESTPDDEITDVNEEADKTNDIKQSPAIEKLRPVMKRQKEEDIKGSVRKKAMMRRSNKRGSSSRKTSRKDGSTARVNFSKGNANRNNANRNDSANMRKYSNQNQTIDGHFSNVDNELSRGRNLSQFNEIDFSNSNKNYSRTGNMKVDPGDKNKIGTSGGQLMQSNKINNRAGSMDAVGNAVRTGGASDSQRMNFNQNSGAAQDTNRQGVDMQNGNAGTTVGNSTHSTNSKSILRLPANAYDNNDMVRDIYGNYVSSKYGIRSSFPSSCTKTNLVYDEKPKTLNFGSQCTEKSFFQEENTTSISDNKITSKCPQTERRMFILKIRTGRQN